MKILLLSSAFSGLTQRFYTELDDAGYIVSVELHHGNIPVLMEGIGLFKPDLIKQSATKISQWFNSQ